MATIVAHFASASVNGAAIPIAATATPGTLLHAATNVAGEIDTVWCWVSNVTAAAVPLTIEWGGAGVANQLVQGLSIPANSQAELVIKGQRIAGGLEVRAFAGTANALNATLDIDRRVP